VRNDYVIERRMFLAEARQSDPDHHIARVAVWMRGLGGLRCFSVMAEVQPKRWRIRMST
jgi:hypothetical protein